MAGALGGDASRRTVTECVLVPPGAGGRARHGAVPVGGDGRRTAAGGGVDGRAGVADGPADDRVPGVEAVGAVRRGGRDRGGDVGRRGVERLRDRGVGHREPEAAVEVGQPGGAGAVDRVRRPSGSPPRPRPAATRRRSAPARRPPRRSGRRRWSRRTPRSRARSSPRRRRPRGRASGRTSIAGSRLPSTSNRRNAGPRELNDSTVSKPGSAWSTAPMVSAPSADEASGSIAPAVGTLCSAIVNVGVPPTMYFMNGERVPAIRRIPIPTSTVPRDRELGELRREARREVVRVDRERRRGRRVREVVEVEREVGLRLAPRLVPLERDEHVAVGERAQPLRGVGRRAGIEVVRDAARVRALPALAGAVAGRHEVAHVGGVGAVDGLRDDAVLEERLVDLERVVGDHLRARRHQLVDAVRRGWRRREPVWKTIFGTPGAVS